MTRRDSTLNSSSSFRLNLVSFTFQSIELESTSRSRWRMNSEQALKSLHIAQKHLDSSNYPSAIRFANKSISLHPTPEAQALLKRAQDLSQNAADQPQASTSGVDPSPSSATSGGAKQRKQQQDEKASPSNSSASSTASWTPAQAAVVKRVKACRVTSYYEILSLEKSCSDADIKKAYRKVSSTLSVNWMSEK